MLVTAALAQLPPRLTPPPSHPALFAAQIDLQYQIADGYRRSPALRLQQLLSMSKRLAKDGRFAEAAQCKVHAAALITEYLHMVEVKSHIPIGAKAFESISPNAIKESAVSDDIGSPDQEGILQHELFDVSGLIRLLLEATDHFRSANMFEAVNEVRFVLPLVRRCLFALFATMPTSSKAPSPDQELGCALAAWLLCAAAGVQDHPSHVRGTTRLQVSCKGARRPAKVFSEHR